MTGSKRLDHCSEMAALHNITDYLLFDFSVFLSQYSKNVDRLEIL
jgi:hypothetical protein